MCSRHSIQFVKVITGDALDDLAWNAVDGTDPVGNASTGLVGVTVLCASEKSLNDILARHELITSDTLDDLTGNGVHLSDPVGDTGTGLVTVICASHEGTLDIVTSNALDDLARNTVNSTDPVGNAGTGLVRMVGGAGDKGKSVLRMVTLPGETSDAIWPQLESAVRTLFTSVRTREEAQALAHAPRRGASAKLTEAVAMLAQDGASTADASIPSVSKPVEPPNQKSKL